MRNILAINSLFCRQNESIDLSTTKEKYISFIKENYVPIFYRDIYLDAVCDSAWDVVLYEEKGQIEGAYIYMLKQKMLLKYIVQPQLCPYTGPIYFNPSDSKKAFHHLVETLPKHHLIIQDYFHNIPLLENDVHTQTNKHTYVLESTTNEEELWQRQSSTHRRIIRKAEKELKYEVEDDINVFLEFVSGTFEKRKKHNPNDPRVFQQLDEKLLEKGMRKIVKCTNDNNLVVAMCYFMKDEQWTYNFANSVIEDYRHYGMNLILWNEIKDTLANDRSFDFEGSMISGIDEFFKRFKGTKAMYQSRYKSSNALVDFLVKMKTSKMNK